MFYAYAVLVKIRLVSALLHFCSLLKPLIG